ncbi:zinc finger CCCH domain-containing protein 14-like isoform X2 [Hylaeus volcanicus]|uniref:zinc finger CCCH domain-containing protein 14-like isoform X2 n=1 Tax=Hylaeus volcanicus TaxID=313075 RepID=UPI0023B7E1F7|nr:zinc finger CCCH domain-containing protein 14-like isoform X2 [Hylaeus volcanicus]
MSEKTVETIVVELQEAITDKLRVILGEEGVEILTEYVWHMLVSSKRNRQHITQELQEFLAKDTASFVDWILTVIVPEIDTYIQNEGIGNSKDRSTDASLEHEKYQEKKNQGENLRRPNDTVSDSLSNEKNVSKYAKTHVPSNLSSVEEKRSRLLGLAVHQAVHNPKKISAQNLSSDVRQDAFSSTIHSSMKPFKGHFRNAQSSKHVRHRFPSVLNYPGHIGSQKLNGGNTNFDFINSSSTNGASEVTRRAPFMNAYPNNDLAAECEDILEDSNVSSFAPPNRVSARMMNNYTRPRCYVPTPPLDAYGATAAPSVESIFELRQVAASLGYTLTPQNVCSYPSTMIQPSVQKQKKRCTKWPDCPFGDQCHHIHPSEMCNNWPHCSFGASCFYIHPQVACKFGLNCHNCNCNYSHPEGWDPTKNAVRLSKHKAYYQNKTLNCMQEDTLQPNEASSTLSKSEENIPEYCAQTLQGNIQEGFGTELSTDVDMNA